MEPCRCGDRPSVQHPVQPGKDALLQLGILQPSVRDRSCRSDLPPGRPGRGGGAKARLDRPEIERELVRTAVSWQW
jgi:hypothetical protein